MRSVAKPNAIHFPAQHRGAASIQGDQMKPVLSEIDSHMAVKRRCPDVGLLHHSDQESTYASEDYQAVLEIHGITGSMSRRGNCYDNAEVFYNHRRRHSSAGRMSPAAFERKMTHAA
jgi:transposase InsO family protein